MGRKTTMYPAAKQFHAVYTDGSGSSQGRLQDGVNTTLDCLLLNCLLVQAWIN